MAIGWKLHGDGRGHRRGRSAVGGSAARRLGGITVVLYGMIGLLGAKIWRENNVDFGNPVNLVPVAAGIIIAIGDTASTVGRNFALSGIALGTIVVIGACHFGRLLAPRELVRQAEAPAEQQPPPGAARVSGEG